MCCGGEFTVAGNVLQCRRSSWTNEDAINGWDATLSALDCDAAGGPVSVLSVFRNFKIPAARFDQLAHWRHIIIGRKSPPRRLTRRLPLLSMPARFDVVIAGMVGPSLTNCSGPQTAGVYIARQRVSAWHLPRIFFGFTADGHAYKVNWFEFGWGVRGAQPRIL